jgi:Zn-dependent peptidase ImmA (M78 family)
LRTTLTHEYGHVRFHDYVWKLDLRPADMLKEIPSKVSPKCNRNALLNAPAVDWMEWQAGYISGALLMPRLAVLKLFSDYSQRQKVFAPIASESNHGLAVRRTIVDTFKVSDDAAKVRLFKLNLLSTRDLGPSLF